MRDLKSMSGTAAASLAIGAATGVPVPGVVVPGTFVPGAPAPGVVGAKAGTAGGGTATGAVAPGNSPSASASFAVNSPEIARAPLEVVEAAVDG